MSRGISRQEQETIILFNEADDAVRISTFNGKLKRKLFKAAEQRPELYKRIGVDDYGGETWEMPKRLLLVNPRIPVSRSMTPEQIEKQTELLRKAREAKTNS